MHTAPVSVSIPTPISGMRTRTVLIASADPSFRQRIRDVLSGLRWQVREAEGGAQAWAEAETVIPEALIVDSWLPDLDVAEFLREFRGCFPGVDMVTSDGSPADENPRGPHRQEILYALRSCQDSDTAAWNSAPTLVKTSLPSVASKEGRLYSLPMLDSTPHPVPLSTGVQAGDGTTTALRKVTALPNSERIPELIGESPCMLEISRRIRLVAPRMTPVLIEGPTGSGKELVAEALHRLSPRSRKPFIAINCAAIPEALLEAELFGHTRGAFTGAVQGRVGRIEAADGGTLFLDEIGEMPLALQAKLLRFVECGELQRIGDNETVKVDVRILAATHRPLVQHAEQGSFRSDLYYRLAVFLIRTPALSEHLEDLPLLVEHFLAKLGREMPVKRLDKSAMNRLTAHTWPGNVRELEHVLERGAILCGDEPVMSASDIDFGHVAG